MARIRDFAALEIFMVRLLEDRDSADSECVDFSECTDEVERYSDWKRLHSRSPFGSVFPHLRLFPSYLRVLPSFTPTSPDLEYDSAPARLHAVYGCSAGGGSWSSPSQATKRPASS